MKKTEITMIVRIAIRIALPSLKALAKKTDSKVDDKMIAVLEELV